MLRSLVLAVLTLCLLATPAHAVVGGEKIAPSDVPWFVMVGVCGGTLVAPDRLLTAAHCVAGHSAADLGPVAVNGELRDVTGFAMHPNWRQANGSGNYLDDVALIRLSAPVTNVTPVTLGGANPREARIIGTGLPFAPGTGHSESEMFSGGGLKQATLRQISDAECARMFRGYVPADGEKFGAARMRCAIDPDGREPLNSGCGGDSGGPLMAGTVQIGVVSWGGDRCGADHLPSVFADVDRYRSFILDPDPTWAPTRTLDVTITRSAKSVLCKTSGPREAGVTYAYVWKRLPNWGQPKTVGHGRRYTPAKSARYGCFVEASNDSGMILAGVANVRT